MNQQTTEFAVITRNGIVIQISRSICYHPEIRYSGKGTKWFDDTKLIRKGGAA